MFRHFRKLITPALLLFVFAFTQPGGAQDFRATLTGRIADTSDAAIPNASITVQNTATGDKFTTTSGGDGNYTVPFLVPGTYTVSAEAPGFKIQSRQHSVARRRQDNCRSSYVHRSGKRHDYGFGEATAAR